MARQEPEARGSDGLRVPEDSAGWTRVRWGDYCSFPVTAVKHHRQLGGLKQEKRMFSQLWRPEVQTLSVTELPSSCLQGCAPLEARREGSFLTSSGVWCPPASLGFWPPHSGLCPSPVRILTMASGGPGWITRGNLPSQDPQ